MIKYILTSLTILSIVILYIWNISRLPTRLEMYVFNTKGDPSIFIRTPDDKRILINGGANSGVIRYLTRVLPFYSKRIDVIFTTTDSKDNITGLIDVLNRYQVGLVVSPNATSSEQIYSIFMNMVDDKETPTKKMGKGDLLDFDKLKIEVLSSGPELVLKVEYGATSFLLLGNVSMKIQKSILAATSSSAPKKADVLMISHSPSASSLSLDLMNTVRPTDIVYSQSLSSKGGAQSSSSKKAPKTDPLYMILDSHRFNLQQKNTVEVLSDGKSVEIRE